ncbi:hypothetical protein PJP10_32950, partial [Mycobacterium kansasii]
MLKEKEDGLNELHASYKQLGEQFRELAEKLHIADKKIEEMVEEEELMKLQGNAVQLELDLVSTQKSELEEQIEKKA